MTSYSYRDASGNLHWSDSSAIPAGCTRHSVRVPQSFIDGAMSADPTRDSMNARYFYTDTAGVTFPSDSPTPPPGCTRSDSNKTGVRQAGLMAAARDAAPASGGYLADSLRACTMVPAHMADKVARGLMDAREATDPFKRANAIDNVRAMGRQFASRAFTAKDGADRDALNRAAMAVSAAADAVSATGGIAFDAREMTPKDARAEMIRGLSDGWKR